MRCSTLESGRKFRRPGGTLPALVASTLGTPMLTRLAPREQEVATIVYLNTGITAKEVEEAVSGEVSNAAIRSMLNRLVAKGILRRRKGEGKFFYSPALLLPFVQERALARVVEDFFGGSLLDASDRLVNIMRETDPQALEVLSRRIAPAPPREPRLHATG